jgi:ribose-phosphate pyrophosphokinase
MRPLPDGRDGFAVGTANEPLARAICKSIGMELGKCTITPFPDGETFVKIEENVRGEDVSSSSPRRRRRTTI